jgi:hypothetical protein
VGSEMCIRDRRKLGLIDKQEIKKDSPLTELTINVRKKK